MVCGICQLVCCVLMSLCGSGPMVDNIAVPEVYLCMSMSQCACYYGGVFSSHCVIPVSSAAGEHGLLVVYFLWQN